MSTKAERLAAARLALVQAEQRAGLNVLRPRFGNWKGSGAVAQGSGAVAQGGGGSLACSTLAEGQQEGRAEDEGRWGLPAGAADCWESLVPSERRQAVAVAGSTSLFLHTLARLQEGQRWCAVVGHPGLGWCAAQEAGVNLALVLAVPQVGERAARVLTALAEGMDVLAIGPGVRLSGREQRFLAGKVRERGGALVAVGTWEGAWQLEATASATQYLGSAEGYIAGGNWRVRVPARPDLGEARFALTDGEAAWSGGEDNANTRVGVRVGT